MFLLIHFLFLMVKNGGVVSQLGTSITHWFIMILKIGNYVALLKSIHFFKTTSFNIFHEPKLSDVGPKT